MATTTMNVRIDDDAKRRAEIISERLGLTVSAAVNIFIRKYNETGGFPFDLASKQAAEDAADIVALEQAMDEDDGTRYTSADVRKELGL